MKIFPQKIEIDLTGTGLVTVFHDIEVMVGGKAVQVMDEAKDEKGKTVKLQPSSTFEACPCLLAVVEEIAASVRDGKPFVFPEHEALMALAEVQKERKPKPIEKPVEEPAGVEGGE